MWLAVHEDPLEKLGEEEAVGPAFGTRLLIDEVDVEVAERLDGTGVSPRPRSEVASSDR